MLAGEGYCFTQVRSAVLTLENANHEFFRISEEEFKKKIHDKEIDRALTQCLYLKRPVYIGIPQDLVDMKCESYDNRKTLSIQE
jgi:TPP-dependent 2-oxoacid decarboxylase